MKIINKLNIRKLVIIINSSINLRNRIVAVVVIIKYRSMAIVIIIKIINVDRTKRQQIRVIQTVMIIIIQIAFSLLTLQTEKKIKV